MQHINFYTKRLLLRPFYNNDLCDLFEIYSQEKTCQYLLGDTWTEENKYDYFEDRIANQQLKEHNTLFLAVVYNNKVIGELQAWYEYKETLEIGFIFNQDFAGYGFAYEAVSAFIDYLFSLDIHRIYARTNSENTPSIKLCQKIELRQEAHIKQGLYVKNNWCDYLIFAILKSEYLVNK